ncbi:hypothetical protein ONZ45_g14716 [Pleurotus djamor]|nr:hypothetical protein ONZ45_g14716 [Pleurotus djamor]
MAPSRLFSRQNLKENLDNETIFGPADVYSSSDDSTSPTISGLTPTPPLPEHTSFQAEGYFDEVGFAIPHEQFINPINVGIALVEEDHEQDWDAGRRGLTVTHFHRSPLPVFGLKSKSPSTLRWIQPSPQSSLMSTLPDDLLQLIFAAYIDLSDSRPNPRHGVLLLGQISRRWRTISHSTPRLWSTLTIIAGTHTCVPRMPLLKAWLNRSALCALDLTVIYDHTLGDTPGNFGSITLVSDIILSHSARWSNVCFNYTRTRQLIDMLARIPSWALPILHSVEISLRQQVAHPEQHSIFSDFLASACHLKQLTCRGISDIPRLTMPSQLTHLDIEAALSPRDCLELLAVGRHLRDCRFHMEYAGSSNLDDLPLLAHPLQSLYVSSQEPLGDFFDHLFLPQLETLGVSARWTADRSLPTWSQQQFVSFLSRSSPPITSFSIRCLPMSDVELLECLLYLSDTLNTLEIYVVGGKGAITITDIAINALTSHDYHNILCPQLENITLSGCVRAADGLLAAMVASRRHGLLSRYFETRQLKHVEVAFPTSNHDRDIFYLKSLQKGGLEGEVVQGYRSGSH